jgi:hypothetical protein
LRKYLSIKLYKYISSLEYLKTIFFLFLFIFLVNYVYNTCNSYISLIVNQTVEFCHDFDDFNKEESEKNEKETEIEDTDEYFLNTLFLNQDYKINNKYNILCKFIELSVFREVDSPPPNC